MKEKPKRTIIIALIVIAIVLFPFVLEWFLYNTPEVSKMTNETWFSFIGSYIGTLITIVLFIATIHINNKNHRVEMKRQIRNSNIDSEINIVNKIVNVLLVNGYNLIYMNDVRAFIAEYDRYHTDFFDYQLRVAGLLERKEFSTTTRDELLKELLTIALNEGSIINSYLDKTSTTNGKNNLSIMVDGVNEVKKCTINARTRINILHEKYISEMEKLKIGY